MARNYKDEYDKFQDSPSQLKKRAALNRANHKRGTYGNNDGLDVSHTKDGIRLEKSSINKGRKEKSRMKGSKRKQTGGYLKGPSHKNGGIAAVVAGKEPVELEGGEYIIKKSSVDKLGKKTLDELNKKGRIPTMKKGGKTKKKQMGGQVASGYKPTANIPARPPFKQGVRMMGHGGEVSVSNDNSSAGDIHTTHSHSGYKAGE